MQESTAWRARARAVERLGWGAAVALLAAAGGWALASRELTDFVGEGPVRVLGVEGRARQWLVALGLLATAGAGLAAWRLGRGALRYGAGAASMACALLLAPPLAVPAAALFALGAVAAFVARASDVRLAQFVPARHPQLWAAGGVATAGALVATSVLSVWLLRPLFDEGRTLDERLDFAVATVASGGASSAEASATVGAASGGAGVVLRQGTLKGADAFHFGSGSVRLLRAADGRQLLRFEEYAVRNGPDLFVYLTPDVAGDVGASGAINLGVIRATQGNVNYELPAGVDASAFRSAVIWCRSFAVTFAVAVLE